MYKGLLLQDATGNEPGTGFGAHFNVGNASEPFALNYNGAGNTDDFTVRKTDALGDKVQGRTHRGQGILARGRTWAFIFRCSQSGS